jgi:ABC-type cobalamin/Fe3+-siderophores transport system ATPase subunit
VFGKGLIEKWMSDPKACPHLFVVGGTGAGKTTLMRKIALSLLQHGSVAVVDFDGEYLTLPLQPVTPPFSVFIPSMSFLGWLVSQASRPEDGGYAMAALSEYFEDTQDLSQVVSRIRHDITLPANVRYAFLWRISIFRKYFVQDGAHADENRVYNLSGILSTRERKVVQQILVSYLIFSSNNRWIIVEEAEPGTWLSDISMEARKRGKRLLLVSQKIPEDLQNFELLLFTPYPIDTRRLPLPINPLYDKGVWWVGRLGVHRLKHLW